MGYQNPLNQLPKELIEQIQEFVDGKIIYIPKKQANKKTWGENTDTKKFLAIRNRQIYQDYKKGMTVNQLSEIYFLSEKSIQRILRQENT